MGMDYMGQLIGVSIGGPYVGIIVAVVVVAIAVIIRFYMMRHQGMMRAKCPRCGIVFDASKSFPMLHFGSMKQLKCPSCGKTSFMNAYFKDPITWPLQEKTQPQQTERQLTEEELEKKRIEDSKYEKTQSV
jgi:ribosomal protein S27AE